MPVKESIDLAEIEQTIYQEADLLDQREFQAWLEMYTNDASYWIPSWKDDTHPTTEPDVEYNRVFYDYQTLEDYVFRRQSGVAHAHEPSERTARIISNIRWLDREENKVQAKYLVQSHRMEQEEIFGGEMEYKFRHENGTLKIHFKKVIVNQGCIGPSALFLV